MARALLEESLGRSRLAESGPALKQWSHADQVRYKVCDRCHGWVLEHHSRTHTSGLTDKIKAFLDKEAPKITKGAKIEAKKEDELEDKAHLKVKK